jgi:uncharacterized membrane protein
VFHKSQWHLHPHVRSKDQLTLGERSADGVRNGMGSWTFIWIQTFIVLIWVLVNLYFLGKHPFDPYPFILLNLAFSTQAAYASPIILLSQRRGDQQSSELAVSTHENGQEILKLSQQQLLILQQQDQTLIQHSQMLQALQNLEKILNGLTKN